MLVVSLWRLATHTKQVDASRHVFAEIVVDTPAECQSPAYRRSTTEMARRNYPLLPLAPLPMALPSITGLAPSSNMFVTQPPLIQLQIDPALQATVPPQMSSVPPPSSSIDACTNSQFVSHMPSIFTERWATEPSTLLLSISNPLHFLPYTPNPRIWSVHASRSPRLIWPRMSIPWRKYWKYPVSGSGVVGILNATRSKT